MEWFEGFLIAFIVAAALASIAVILVFTIWGAYWFQAYMCGADVSMKNLIVMSFLRIEHRLIVTAKIMGRQAGLPIDRANGMSTERLMAHHMAGGEVMNVIRAIIAARHAGIALDFDRAAAIDLAGREVLLAVQTSVSPKVISCPRQDGNGKKLLSAVAKNGVEVLVGLKLTVRTNIDQLIGGATEETIIARCGQEIIAAVGAANSHMDVLAAPSLISKRAMARGVDANSAFSIISIDISDIELGANIGARLQTDQAMADTQIARALAESRRAEALAETQWMKAKVVEAQAKLVLAEAVIPAAMAEVFRRSEPDADYLIKFPKLDRA